jgi:predicted dithiol-disulfide oxidoreductase (DUF899 family)
LITHFSRKRIIRRKDQNVKCQKSDFGVTTDAGETFRLSVFLRNGDDVYLTYFTSDRGLEALGTLWSLLDVTPYGRQETWEDSPAGGLIR